MSQTAPVETATPAIGTVAASRDTTIDARTGEPRRPLWVWVSAALLHVGTATITVGLLWAFWGSVRTFEEAAWLNRVVPTEPGALLRVLMVTALFVVTLLIGAAASITAYYGWWGHRWTRWAGVITIALAPLALMINPVASWGIVPLVVGAALLWLPPVTRWFERWWVRRHPAPSVPGTADAVQYGPLPKYRA